MSSYRRRLMLANQTEENLVLYGNSVQDGTPTPEAPIDIMSIENPIIKVTGKNLINNTLTSQTSNDVEVIVNGSKIQSIEIGIAGTLQSLFSKIQSQVGAEFVFE